MSQHNEQRHETMAQEGRKKTINDVLDVWNLVFVNGNQDNEQWHEKMAQEGRKKTINNVLDVMNQVFENTSRHNERRQGRKQVFENARQDNEQGGLLIWHTSM
jgi:hypothetical protein